MGNISDTDKLAEIGQKIASVLIENYSSRVSGTHLAFLPGGVSVPSSNIIQSGLINPLQLQQWLLVNFDSPFIISKEDCAAHQKDISHGTASRIYSFAVTSARPACKPGDEAWERISNEIAVAKSSLGITNVTKPIVCEPEDWMLSSDTANYWSIFDSEQSDTIASKNETTSTPPVPEISPQLTNKLKINPEFWMVRSLTQEALPVTSLSTSLALKPETEKLPILEQQQITAFTGHTLASVPLSARTLNLSPALMKQVSLVNRPVEAGSSSPSPAMTKPAHETLITAMPFAVKTETLINMQVSEPHIQIWNGAAATGQLLPIAAKTLYEKSIPVLNVTAEPATTTTTESSIVSEKIQIYFEHQCVTLGYYSDGMPWWDNVFLSDRDWYIPGMQQGELLPSLNNGINNLEYGLPMALIIVRNLRMTSKWSDEATKALSSSGGTLGPLSLFGKSSVTDDQDGSITFSHEGMQVIAVLCSSLPVLPPVNSTSELPN